MNVKQARKILSTISKDPGKDGYGCPPEILIEESFCKGFIEGYESAHKDAEKLVEALDRLIVFSGYGGSIKDCSCTTSNDVCPFHIRLEEAKIALEAYRKQHAI